MGLRVARLGEGKLASAMERYGVKPGTGPEDAELLLILLEEPSMAGAALDLLSGESVMGGLVAVYQGSKALGPALDTAARARSSGRRVAVLLASGSGLVEDWMEEALRGLRAASTVLDLSPVLYGYTEGEAEELADRIGGVQGFYEPGDALETIREAAQYGGLYIGSYLAEYYNVEGLDEDGLSRSLGVYLALRSVLEASGGNAVIVNCGLLRDSGIEPGLAVHLLLDEGVPTACGGDEEMLRLQMLSLSITGKPGPWGSITDYIEGSLYMELDVVPTLASSEPRLVAKGGYYVPANKVKRGPYTLLQESGRPTVVEAEAEPLEGGARIPGVEPWGLASSKALLAPGHIGLVARWAFYFLGLAPLSPPIPLR